MDNKLFISQVKKGIKPAFDLDLNEDEIGEHLYPFDPMLYGDWSLGIGDGIITLCGHPVELVVTCEPELPCQMNISVMAGNTAAADRDRVYAIIEALEKELGEEIIFNDVNESDPLIMNFDITVDSAAQISAAIADTVNRLTSEGCAALTEELLRLCGK